MEVIVHEFASTAGLVIGLLCAAIAGAAFGVMLAELFRRPPRHVDFTALLAALTIVFRPLAKLYQPAHRDLDGIRALSRTTRADDVARASPFKAFIARALRHGERFGDGFNTEYRAHCPA